MANVFISVPILGNPELQMMYSMYSTALSTRKHKVRVYYNHNDSLIQRCRNNHISTFLDQYPDCEYFISLDSDLEIINCYHNNNLVDKLIEHDLDFVGGLYALKRDGAEKAKCSSIPLDSNMDIQFDTGLIEMRWLSSGCWCIKREAARKIAEAYPDQQYDGDDNMTGQKVYGIYNPMIIDLKAEDFPNAKLPFRKLLSEDWSLCERWRNIGGKIYADTSIALYHYGKKAYKLWNVEVVKQEITPKQNDAPQVGFDL